MSLSLISPVPVALGLGIAALDLALWAVYRRAARPAVADVFFGVTVPPDWPDSPAGLAVADRYRLWINGAAVAAVAMAATATLLPHRSPAHVLLMVGGAIGQSLVATAAYVAGRRAVLPHAAPTPTVRQASLEPGRGPTVAWWLLMQLGPVAVLGASAAGLATRWPSIPDPMPVHFDLANHADRWASRSVGTVFWPAGVGLLTCGFICTVGLVTTHSGRRLRDAGRGDRYLSAVLGLALAGEYVAAVVMSAASWAPALHGTRAAAVPWWVAMGTTPVLAVVIGYFAVRLWPALRAAGGGGDGSPDGCWRWGLIYANPADPAVLVPKRFGFGYTLNFARGGTWVLVAGTVLYVAAVVAVPLLTGRR